MAKATSKDYKIAGLVIFGIIALATALALLANSTPAPVAVKSTPISNRQNQMSTTSTNSSPSASSGSTSTTAQPTYRVGDTITFDNLAVTLNQIIDPATADNSYETPDAGMRFVAVDITIQNNATTTYTDDANSNLTIIGADNQAYTFATFTVSRCTNFSYGTYTLTPGDSETGCVSFEMPQGVAIKGIRFQDNGGEGDGGQWKIES